MKIYLNKCEHGVYAEDIKLIYGNCTYHMVSRKEILKPPGSQHGRSMAVFAKCVIAGESAEILLKKCEDVFKVTVVDAEVTVDDANRVQELAQQLVEAAGRRDIGPMRELVRQLIILCGISR